jgi:hypothetical protein
VAKYVQPIIGRNLVLLQNLSITSSVDDTLHFWLSANGKNTLTPTANLKSLNLGMHNKTCYTTHEQLMTYIMEQFLNLDSFRVENSGKVYEIENTPQSPNLLQFLIYLSKMTILVFPRVRKMSIGHTV